MVSLLEEKGMQLGHGELVESVSRVHSLHGSRASPCPIWFFLNQGFPQSL